MHILIVENFGTSDLTFKIPAEETNQFETIL